MNSRKYIIFAIIGLSISIVSVFIAIKIALGWEVEIGGWGGLLYIAEMIFWSCLISGTFSLFGLIGKKHNLKIMIIIYVIVALIFSFGLYIRIRMDVLV